jgi:hypothetical protein
MSIFSIGKVREQAAEEGCIGRAWGEAEREGRRWTFKHVKR